jgi:hypothetical protein
MTSVYSIVRYWTKDFKDDIVENKDDGGSGTDSTDCNATRFVTAVCNETSVSENILSVTRYPCIVHYGMFEDNYEKSGNRWPRTCQWLATSAILL